MIEPEDFCVLKGHVQLGQQVRINRKIATVLHCMAGWYLELDGDVIAGPTGIAVELERQIVQLGDAMVCSCGDYKTTDSPACSRCIAGVH